MPSVTEVNISADELRSKIIQELSDGADWLQMPHQYLAGRSPEQAIQDGDIGLVENLLYSLLYIGAN